MQFRLHPDQNEAYDGSRSSWRETRSESSTREIELASFAKTMIEQGLFNLKARIGVQGINGDG
jgi:hypothetical protein